MIKTKRLLLRERTLEILQQIIQMPTEKQMTFLGHTDIEVLKIDLKRIQTAISTNNAEVRKWDIIESSSKQTIGSLGFHNWFADHERAEIGYILQEDYRGKGYMSEAIAKIIDLGFTELGLNRIEAFISPNNIPSIKLVESFGFKKEGLLREHYKMHNEIHDSLVFGLLKAEYNP